MSAPELLAAATHPTVPLPTSGPYDVQSTAALAIVLQPNPYAAVRPSIKSYELRLFVTFADAAYAFSHGSVDALLATTPEELHDAPDRQGSAGGDHDHPEFVDLMFNERVPALADSVVRHAIGVAINRSAVVAGALDGRRRRGPDRSVLGGHPVGRTSRLSRRCSPTVAASVLQANGWVAGPGGVRHRGPTQLAFTLAVPDINPLPLVAREVATQLAAIGVRGDRECGSCPRRFSAGTLDSGQFQLAIDAWNPVPDPDVSAFWRSNAAPPHGYNVSGGTADPFLDAALDMLAEVPDRAARLAAAAQVAALVADDAPAVFLYTPRVRSSSDRPRRPPRCPRSDPSPRDMTTSPRGSCTECRPVGTSLRR